MENITKISIEAGVLIYTCTKCGRRVGDATGFIIHAMDTHGYTLTQSKKILRTISKDKKEALDDAVKKHNKSLGPNITWLF